MNIRNHSSFKEHLAEALPQGLELDYFHISTPPTLAPALFAPPPGQPPHKTYCEEHFLNVTHNTNANSDGSNARRIAIFAIEIYIYTTASLTTVFVSKADSTGFAQLVSVPLGHRSILKTITSTFVDFLVHNRSRKGRRLNVALFARAQDQYIFPGSVENATKHVLTDRGLVKWWCTTLDPVLRRYPHPTKREARSDTSLSISSQGYLVVPGHDPHETTAFFPSTARSDAPDSRRWRNGHPLRELTDYPSSAPRSIIPHFPDDPKSRFLLDLDEELANAAPSGETKAHPSPSKRGTGQWMSVKTLEQFWEMMAFRQECSSGRLVGFLWITFNPADLGVSKDANPPPSPSLRPAKRKHAEVEGKAESNTRARKSRPYKKLRVMEGTIIARQPRVKNVTCGVKASKLPTEKSKLWYWPAGSRGAVVLSEKSYERVMKILHRLDFANEGVARTSTGQWIRQTAIISGSQEEWGIHVIGKAESPLQSLSGAGPSGSQSGALSSGAGPPVGKTRDINTLDTGLIKRRAAPVVHETMESSSTLVNRLESNLLRKKPKT